MSYRSFSLIPSFGNTQLSDRFAQIDNLFSRLTGENPVSDTPSYNLFQKDKDHYEMMISVPGYTQDELDVSVLNNKLSINGKIKSEEKKLAEKKDNTKLLHQGFKKSNFSLSFNLEHRIAIQQAHLNNGLLILQFFYDIPEQEKPQKIAIGTKSESSRLFEHKS